MVGPASVGELGQEFKNIISRPAVESKALFLSEPLRGDQNKPKTSVSCLLSPAAYVLVYKPYLF